MADASLPQKAVDLANERWGRIDSLVVNHGTLDPVKKVADSSAEEWRKGFDVNVFSAVGMVSWVFCLLPVSFVMLFPFNLYSYPPLGPSRSLLPPQNLWHHPPNLLRRRDVRLPRLGLLRRR